MRNDRQQDGVAYKRMLAGVGAMQDRNEDFKDSFYFRAIQVELGERLRKQYNLTEPWPQRWTELLQQLDRVGTRWKRGAPKSTRDTEER